MKLKHHQQKLLRKVDFLSWKSDNTLREASVMRRYHVTGREDYVKYSRLVGQVTSFVARLKATSPAEFEAFRFCLADTNNAFDKCRAQKEALHAAFAAAR